ncbi:MAG: DNA primase [Bacteroidales bacterium]|nr:DNA primase [Bacteroidales bacterium]
MITKQNIDQINETARVEEVISDFILLKRRGANYVGLCPFHNEKTPSFHVSPSRNIYKCFGCGKGGNAVNFIMEHEHFTYPEALKYLAKKYHIEIEEQELTPEMQQEENERQALYNLYTFAQKYFNNFLQETEDGRAVGLTYFSERGFSKETINKFQLGYCGSRDNLFSEHCRQNGYKEDLLLKSGLSGKRSDGSLYDFYFRRVIFPIHNLSGRVIGFGGRILTSDKSKAKYVNSPESEIYHKSDILYGIYYAKNAIVKNNNCYLVEGYTDVISLHQSEIENVVASSGTSLTVNQIKLIKRFTPNITILYDGDDAGIKASFRGIDMILKEGMNVRIVLFPEGEDPDSFARKNTISALQDFIRDKATDFILFKTKLLNKDIGNDPVRKSELIKDIINSIALIPDLIVRAEYIKECSRIMNIQEQTLINQLNKVLRQNFVKERAEKTTVAEEVITETKEIIQEAQAVIQEDTFEDQEKEIIRLLLNYGNKDIVFSLKDPENPESEEEKHKVAVYITENLKEDKDLDGNKIVFNKPVYERMFNLYTGFCEENNIRDKEYFINNTDEELRQAAVDILSQPYELSPNWDTLHNIIVVKEEDKLTELVIRTIMGLKLKRTCKNKEENAKRIEICKDEDEIIKLMMLQRDLEKIIMQISSYLERIVIK